MKIRNQKECGNFSQEDPQMEVFASGTNAASVRLGLALASQLGWHEISVDIRTTFLNADMKLGQVEAGDCKEGEKKKALIKPPAILKELGHVEEHGWWLVPFLATSSRLIRGCSVLQWGKSLLLWKSSKQALRSTSTAEAELIEFLDAATAGEAVRVVVAKAFTDPSSALTIATGDTGSWRTRHLRRRALSLRWRITRGDWVLRHVPGTEMPADLGTKPLSFEKFSKFMEMMGMSMERKSEEEQHSQEKGKDSQEIKSMKLVSATGNVEVRKALAAVLLIAQFALTNSQGEEDSGLCGLNSSDVLVIGL
eukprot:s3094_g13.t1